MPLINKRWDGSRFRQGATFRRWTGSAWKSGATVRVWNGSDWVPSLKLTIAQMTGGYTTIYEETPTFIIYRIGHQALKFSQSSISASIEFKGGGTIEYWVIGNGGRGAGTVKNRADLYSPGASGGEWKSGSIKLNSNISKTININIDIQDGGSARLICIDSDNLPRNIIANHGNSPGNTTTWPPRGGSKGNVNPNSWSISSGQNGDLITIGTKQLLICSGGGAASVSSTRNYGGTGAADGSYRSGNSWVIGNDAGGFGAGGGGYYTAGTSALSIKGTYGAPGGVFIKIMK